MQIRVVLAATVAAFSLAASPTLAGPFQVDVQGVAAVSQDAFEDVLEAEDIIGTGAGLIGDVLYGVTDNLLVGAQAGWYRAGEGDFFDDLPAGADFDLRTVPVHALAQVRTGGGFGLYAQGGIGFTNHSLSSDAFGDDSQTSFSWLLGGGFSIGLPGPVALTAGLNYHVTRPDEGDLFTGEEEVKSWLLTIGVRFHTD